MLQHGGSAIGISDHLLSILCWMVKTISMEVLKLDTPQAFLNLSDVFTHYIVREWCITLQFMVKQHLACSGVGDSEAACGVTWEGAGCA